MPRTLDSYIPRAEKVTPLSPQISLYELRFHHELFETPAILSLAGSSNPQWTRFTCGGVVGQMESAWLHHVTTRSALFKISRSMTSDV